MSTPIETNTEELQEILQTVYNLPDAGGGSSEPDLVITPLENFEFTAPGVDPNYNLTNISFNASEVVSTYEKLMAGKDVRAVFTGYLQLNSYSPKFMTTHPAMRVLAYGGNSYGSDGNFLVVRFKVAYAYFFLSDDQGSMDIEYRFEINPNTGEVTLDGAAFWSET